jgi:hypothetical protein
VGERGKAMSGHPDEIAEHYRELAAEEVALARAAVTNEARANITRWRLSIGASRRPQRMKSSNDHQAARRPSDDARQHARARRARAPRPGSDTRGDPSTGLGREAKRAFATGDRGLRSR